MNKAASLKAITAYGETNIAPLILNYTRCMKVVSFKTRPLCPREKEPPVSIKLEAGRDPQPVQTLWKVQKYLLL
jgi:hypothetical protein